MYFNVEINRQSLRHSADSHVNVELPKKTCNILPIFCFDEMRAVVVVVLLSLVILSSLSSLSLLSLLVVVVVVVVVVGVGCEHVLAPRVFLSHEGLAGLARDQAGSSYLKSPLK